MPKVKLVALGLTHPGYPGEFFKVEIWEGDLPERLDSIPVESYQSGNVKDWALKSLSYIKRMNLGTMSPSYRLGLGPFYVLMRERTTPTFNEYGEVSP